MENLWSKVNYASYMQCLIDTQIRVYDITKANISVLRETEVISQDEYVHLFNADKLEREIYIGKLQGSRPEVSKVLADGIINAKRVFISSNNIDDNDILEINNDAVYLIGNKPVPVQQVSPFVYFKLAEQYTSFYKVKDIRYYYYANMMTRTEYLNPKGLGKARALHEAYMLDFLKVLFYTAQFQGTQEALKLLSAFYEQYTNKTLDIAYYRNLNPASRYNIKMFDKYASYQTDIITSQNLRLIDPSYNEKILREFNKLLIERYLKEYR